MKFDRTMDLTMDSDRSDGFGNGQIRTMDSTMDSDRSDGVGNGWMGTMD